MKAQGSETGDTAAFLVIPAVDLLGDEAVRLHRGDYERITVRAMMPAIRLENLAPPAIGRADHGEQPVRGREPGPHRVQNFLVRVRAPLDQQERRFIDQNRHVSRAAKPAEARAPHLKIDTRAEPQRVLSPADQQRR